MNDDVLRKRFQRAARLTWKDPSDRALRAVLRSSGVPPVPLPPPASPTESIRPEDVRGVAVAGAEPAMVSRSLPGVDATLLVTPPVGDGLWTVQGRVWRAEDEDVPVRVVLATGPNVLGDRTVSSGGGFRFQEALWGDWALEFHLAPGRVSVILGRAT